MKNNEAIEIYIHVPFCDKKCAYCDFVSFVCKDETKAAYFAALNKEIRIKAANYGPLYVSSVFFGGGTPSSVPYEFILETLNTIRDCFVVDKDAEITIEVNPHSGYEEKLKAYHNAGINRLSIGLQSTKDDELKTLSRLHDFVTFKDTYLAARRAGFTNINIDLMSALPGQTIESYRETLETVVALNPEHISAYSLIIEEGTPFFDLYSEGTGLPTEDEDREMYHLTKDILKSNNYFRYEISNYSKEGYECRHNKGYWTRKNYLGFGISAASLFDNKRFMHKKDLNKYIEGDFTEETEEITAVSAMEEFMFLGLRLTDGILVSDFEKEFGRKITDEYGDVIKKLCKEGLMTFDEKIKLTDKGLDVSNYCMSQFIK